MISPEAYGPQVCGAGRPGQTLGQTTGTAPLFAGLGSGAAETGRFIPGPVVALSGFWSTFRPLISFSTTEPAFFAFVSRKSVVLSRTLSHYVYG